MARIVRRVFLLGLLSFFAVSFWTVSFAKEIKIGVIGPMQFVQGISQWNGAQLAAEEINARGGVQVGDEKMQIRLIRADSNELLNTTDGPSAMDRLMTRDKVDFVLGGFRTEAVLVMQDIAMEHKKIFIGIGPAHADLCTRVATDYDTYKYWFRGSPFNSALLGRTSFLNLGYVAGVLKETLNIPQIKVAFVGEKAAWVDPVAKAAQDVIPKMGMELVGVWRPSERATDVTAELSAIQRSGAHIIFTIFSSSVGITFARQAGELEIPAMQVGVNVEAQKDGFWDATQGMGNYAMTVSIYARGLEYNDLTKPFVENYIKKFGETPTAMADTYAAIAYMLVPAIEKTGTLDSDKLVAFLENQECKVPSGVVALEKDAEGRPLHDLRWGPGYLTYAGFQWQDGALKGVWPNKWKAGPQAPEITYKGIVPLKIPPWMIEKYKK